MSERVGVGGLADTTAASERRKAVVNAHLELGFAALVRSIERGWVDQHFSPLGVERHIDAVRRRVERQTHDAAIIGGRYLLTIDALVTEHYRDEPANENASEAEA